MADIEAVLFVAGKPDREGNILPADELRKMADETQCIFWDEQQQALVYRGPAKRAWVEKFKADINRIAGTSDREELAP